ncbi:hypothetical protein P280DRAFT_541213 [Massarina eburnea CBS 473.64]|uniref:Uncharacterized protein n=1 Tax=Massarina eburnea CBS 473.64 TaxID=1395130 RepID=A0A6A6S388_9PLEO|nr:hypothetical protein P280DRAFT_541213 [Massarina eburnea CBS 473.64]
MAPKRKSTALLPTIEGTTPEIESPPAPLPPLKKAKTSSRVGEPSLARTPVSTTVLMDDVAEHLPLGNVRFSKGIDFEEKDSANIDNSNVEVIGPLPDSATEAEKSAYRAEQLEWCTLMRDNNKPDPFGATSTTCGRRELSEVRDLYTKRYGKSVSTQMIWKNCKKFIDEHPAYPKVITYTGTKAPKVKKVKTPASKKAMSKGKVTKAKASLYTSPETSDSKQLNIANAQYEGTQKAPRVHGSYGLFSGWNPDGIWLPPMSGNTGCSRYAEVL